MIYLMNAEIDSSSFSTILNAITEFVNNIKEYLDSVFAWLPEEARWALGAGIIAMIVIKGIKVAVSKGQEM